MKMNEIKVKMMVETPKKEIGKIVAINSDDEKATVLIGNKKRNFKVANLVRHELSEDEVEKIISDIVNYEEVEKEVAVTKEEVKEEVVEKKESKVEIKENKKSKSESNNKYWENEDPIFSQTDGNEIRFYEEAGKFQIYNRISNGRLSRGVTIDVAECSVSEGMKVVSNIVFAFKNVVHDDRFDEAIRLLETINMEINTGDYTFDSKEELEELGEDTLTKIARNMGIKIKLKGKAHIIDTILERQQIILADQEMEE